MVYEYDYETAHIGTLTLASNGESLIGLWLSGQKYFKRNLCEEISSKGDRAPFAEAIEWLDRYFAGEPVEISSLHLNPHGTVFQKRVWKQLELIPYGQLSTYGTIAATLAAEDGKTTESARAVGTAVGKNPISIIIPCHRVVGSNGSLTGYAGGIERKLWLLEHEGIDTTTLKIPTRGTAL